MGPFGTMLILPMFPELRREFEASSEAVAWGLSAYMLPMAALLLVSGTIGERYGRSRALRVSLGCYAVASLATAAAPTLAMFLVGRGLQGACNAFFTPLLLASLADLTPPGELGAKVGIYSSLQAAGGALGPFLGGVAADTSWRMAYLGTALLALGLIVLLPSQPRLSDAPRVDIRPLLTRRMLIIGFSAFCFAAGPYAGSVLIGLKARDLLGLAASDAGLIIFAGSAAGFVMGPVWGRLADRFGPARSGAAATLLSAASLAALSLPDHWLPLVAVWVVVGGASVGVITALGNLAATAVTANRSGALSLSMAFRFTGHALGPVFWVPVFSRSAAWAFGGASLLGCVAALLFVRLSRTTPQT